MLPAEEAPHLRVEIEMPQLSEEAGDATLLAWLVEVGDVVAAGDPIAEVETDKATAELEAERAGRVLEILVAAGTENVKAGSVLARLEVDDEQEEAAPESTPSTDFADSASTAVAESELAEPASVPPSREPVATPLARRLSQQRGVALESIAGSGPHGRILRSDVDQHADSSGDGRALAEEGGAPSSLRRHSAMRRTIARRLSDAKQSVPHFYLRVRCEADELLRLRERLAAGGQGSRISLNDLVVRAAALALAEVPEANVSWREEGLVVYERVDVSVAVATPGGLVTPVLRGADRKGLERIAEELRELAGRAREGALRPEEYRGGTLTVSNLGMYGVETVYPILNPPQACILGVGAAERCPVVRGEADAARVEIGHVMACTLAADHRAVDGAVGAELLAAFRRRVEDPLSMML